MLCIKLPNNVLEYRKCSYPLFFRLFILIPIILFFVLTTVGLPFMWLYISCVLWLIAGVLLVPSINILARHHMRRPIMQPNNEELKNIASTAFFHDALFVIAFFTFMVYLPILSRILPIISQNFRNWLAP